MNQDVLVGKLMLNIEEFHVDIRTALAQAYAAGFDARGKELVAHNKKKVIKYDQNGTPIGEYLSITDAAKKHKCSRDVIDDSISGRTERTRKGYYFRYAS